MRRKILEPSQREMGWIHAEVRDKMGTQEQAKERRGIHDLGEFEDPFKNKIGKIDYSYSDVAFPFMKGFKF
jgi:hypothetical protein